MMYEVIVVSHITLAVVTLIVGAYILIRPKGTPHHKLIGRIWVATMAFVAIGSFGLRDLNPGGFSFIHGLSIFVLLSMAYAIFMIRRGECRAHFMAMIGCLIGAFVAGALTLNPNRMIGGIFFGG